MRDNMTAKSLFEKVWDAHVVEPEGADKPAVIYIDLHLVHEVTSPQAFSELDARGLKVRPDRTFATLDHSIPTLRPDADGNRPYVTAQAKKQVETLEANAAKNGVRLFGYDAENRGVVHVIQVVHVLDSSRSAQAGRRRAAVG